MSCILIEKGREKGRYVSLPEEGLVVFGRGSDCDVVLEDSLLSRRHFSIECVRGEHWLFDQNSQNGTSLNGKPAVTELLKVGDEFSAASSLFTCVSDDEAQGHWRLLNRPVGGYEIQERLGRGGMGTVYLATQPGTGRKVAIKILSPRLWSNSAAKKRFENEALAAERLNHPRIVQAIHFGQDGASTYLVMEYLSGGSLEDILSYTDRLLPLGALEAARDAAFGLEYLERMSIIHRDIKPENLFLDGEGRVKLGDMGIAISALESAEHMGVVIGTPHYMAPEQALAMQVDHRVDIYALGGTLYRMLSGRYPFEGQTPAVLMDQQIRDTPPPLHRVVPEVHPELSLLVQQMMAKPPDRRPQHAGELVSALEVCLDQERKRLSDTPHPAEREIERQSMPMPYDLDEDKYHLPKPLRVLIVDDDPRLIGLLSTYLEVLNCYFVTAENGPEAIRKFQAEHFDLVITDRQMPGMSGDEVAVALNQFNPSIPIVMLTALGMEMRVKGERPQCVDLVISKPISLRRLQRVLALFSNE